MGKHPSKLEGGGAALIWDPLKSSFIWTELHNKELYIKRRFPTAGDGTNGNHHQLVMQTVAEMMDQYEIRLKIRIWSGKESPGILAIQPLEYQHIKVSQNVRGVACLD